MGFISSGEAFIGGTLLDTWSAERANDQARDLFFENQRFQERMSNTAHQREMRDLEKAGLNPMLAAKYAGASSPGGSGIPTMRPATAETGKQAVSAIQSAAQNSLIEAETQKVTSETAVAQAQAALLAAQLPKVHAETLLTTNSASHVLKQMDKISHEIPVLKEEVKTHVQGRDESKSRMKSQEKERDLKDTEIKRNVELLPWIKGQMAQDYRLQGQKEARSLNEEAAQSSWWMKNVSPYLPDILKSTTSAAGASRILK